MNSYSILQMIHSYKVLFVDSNIIIVLFAAIMAMGNIALLCKTTNWHIFLFVCICGVIGILSIMNHIRKLIPLLKKDDCINYFSFAVLEYLMLIIGFIPINLYLCVNLQWQWVDKYEIGVLSQFNQYLYWGFPVATVLMISITYWIVIYYLKKENRLLHLFETTKAITYEK